MLHNSRCYTCDVALSSSVGQQSFQGIDTPTITDSSLKSIEGSLYPKKKTKITTIYLKQKSAEITGRLI